MPVWNFPSFRGLASLERLASKAGRLAIAGAIMGKLRQTLAILGLGLFIFAPTAGQAASPAPAFNWSGWYVTGSAGWGWRSQNDYPPDSYYTGLGANFSGGAGYGGSGGGGTARYNGFSSAFGAGYNYQFGALILGAEYEFIYADLQTNPTNATTSFTNGGGISPPAIRRPATTPSMATAIAGTASRGRASARRSWIAAGSISPVARRTGCTTPATRPPSRPTPIHSSAAPRPRARPIKVTTRRTPGAGSRAWASNMR